MSRLLILVLSVLWVDVVFAENWVCYDAQSFAVNKLAQGDCKSFGLCSGNNNQGLAANCIESTASEYIKAGLDFVKFDGSVISGDRIVDMTQPEKDAVIAARAVVLANAESARIVTLDDLISAVQTSDMTITKIDNAINAINNLADAKVFLKKLCRAIIILEKQ